jgi:hypothetical protein
MIKSDNPTRCNIEITVKDDGVIQETRSKEVRSKEVRSKEVRSDKGEHKQSKKFITVSIIIFIIVIASILLYKNKTPSSIYNSIKF